MNYIQNLHWPQLWWIGIALFSLLINAVEHGKPMVDKDGAPKKYSFPARFVGLLISAFLLTAGGFFS